MPDDRAELLDEYRDMHADLLAAVDGLGDDQQLERSIDGWSVKDHLAHLATWDEIRAAEVERISAGYASTWRMTDEQDETFNAITYDLRRDLPLAQVHWELERAHERLMDAIAAATPAGLDASRYGEAGLRSGHARLHAGWIRDWRERRGL
jgi:uncharacterized damage-inducible protein DinB